MAEEGREEKEEMMEYLGVVNNLESFKYWCPFLAFTMTIETIPGDLRAVLQLEEGILQHWDELSRDQTVNPSLGDQTYLVADYPQYDKKSEEPMLYLARGGHNLVIRHLFDDKNSSWKQLPSNLDTNNFFFHPNRDEAQAVIEDASTLPVPLRALRLQREGSEYHFLQVRTEDGFVNISTNPEKPRFDKPTAEEQQLLERAGYTSAFLNALRNFFSPKVQVSNLYVLGPELALRAVAEGPVGLVAWRDAFYKCANSYAFSFYVSIYSALRGVRQVVAPQGRALGNKEVPSAPQEITLTDCYQRVLADPTQAVRALNDERAAGLSRLLADYLATRRQ